MQPFASRDLMVTCLTEEGEWVAERECDDCSNCTDQTNKPPDEDNAGTNDLAALREQLHRTT